MMQAPMWVYILFFVLLYMGIKRCSTRVVSLERIVIVPFIFIFISLHGTIKLLHFSETGFLLLTAGACIGALIGYIHIRHRNIRADKNNRLIEIPGDISMLLMLMSIFFIEFFIHYAVDAHWKIAQLNLFENIAVTLSGLIVGISIGRTITYFSKYIQAESIQLKKQS